MYLDRDGAYVIYEGERDRRKVILVKSYDMADFIEQFRRNWGGLPHVLSCFELSIEEFNHLEDNSLYDALFDGE